MGVVKKTKEYTKTKWNKPSRSKVAPKKPKRKRKPMSISKRLDILWSKTVRQRAGNSCEVCGGKKSVQAHHYIGRTNRRFRWDLRNGVSVCGGHHKLLNTSFHADPIWAMNWMEENRDEDLTYLENEDSLGVKKWTDEEKLEHFEKMQKYYEKLLKNPF